MCTCQAQGRYRCYYSHSVVARASERLTAVQGLKYRSRRKAGATGFSPRLAGRDLGEAYATVTVQERGAWHDAMIKSLSSSAKPSRTFRQGRREVSWGPRSWPCVAKLTPWYGQNLTRTQERSAGENSTTQHYFAELGMTSPRLASPLSAARARLASLRHSRHPS